MKMKILSTVCISALLLSLSSCGISEGRAHRAGRKASKAQESVSKEKLKLMEQYKKCVKKAAGDPEKEAACESSLKAAEAL